MISLILVGLCRTLVVIGSVFWIAYAVSLTRRQATRRLVDTSPEPPEGGFPALTVVIAAKDEGATIEAGLKSVVDLSYPELHIVVVNDRSTDETGAILDRIARDDLRVQAITIEELPDGWLGKNWALQTGLVQSSSAWILFTDADVVFEPSALQRAAHAAIELGADHVTIEPRVPLESFGERCFYAYFLIMFGIHAPAKFVENRTSKASMGLGAFNLVRREAIEAIGSFRRITLSVDDDMRLGQAIKFAGYQSRVLDGRELISVRWQVGTWGMVTGMEKNFFAGIDFRMRMVAVAVFGMLVTGLAPFVGLLVGPNWLRLVAAAGCIALAMTTDRIGRRSGIRWYDAFAIPLSSCLMAFTLLRSTWLTLRRRGVRWRDSFYPLGRLRSHVAARNAWLRELWLSTR